MDPDPDPRHSPEALARSREIFVVGKALKEQCQEFFFYLYLKENSIWAPYEQDVTVSRTFSFLQRN